MPRKARTCEVAGCLKKHESKGRCSSHRVRDPEKLRAYRSRPATRQRAAARKRAAYHKSEETRAAKLEEARRARYKRVYGITVEQHDEMFKAQEGVCAICRKPPRGRCKRLSIDHNHRTGKVRKLLCVPCNHDVGIVEGPKFKTICDYLA